MSLVQEPLLAALADFIQKYIFPGGMLPSETRLKKVTDKAGLRWTAIGRFGWDDDDTLLPHRRRQRLATVAGQSLSGLFCFAAGAPK
jgi:cyclopropane fatty-acyl-phospholipid synthase-like methyltransferase